MKILLNGEQRGLEEALTLGGLIDCLALSGKRLAVEVNEEVVPRSLHAEYCLHEGDRVEIVHAIGGG